MFFKLFQRMDKSKETSSLTYNLTLYLTYLNCVTICAFRGTIISRKVQVLKNLLASSVKEGQVDQLIYIIITYCIFKLYLRIVSTDGHHCRFFRSLLSLSVLRHERQFLVCM